MRVVRREDHRDARLHEEWMMLAVAELWWLRGGPHGQVG